MSENFTYRPLPGKTSALCASKPSPSRASAPNSTPISLTLIHHNPHQKPPAPFWALSYIWGSTNDPQTTWGNGNPFQVTFNLHEALVQYRRQFLSTSKRAAEAGVGVIWIDAICINQADNAENSVQVPQMTEVYGLFERVLAWLGPVADEEAADVALMVGTLNQFDEEVRTTGIEYSDVMEAFGATKTLGREERTYINQRPYKEPLNNCRCPDNLFKYASSYKVLGILAH